MPCPIQAVLLALYLIATYLSLAVTGLTLGRMLLTLVHRSDIDSRAGLLMAMTLGLLVLAALHVLPVPGLGIAVTLLAVLSGVRALWLGLL